ncbi:MAG: hypothetical protein DMF95_24810 [Acidobacteria bacterium]|nr:MAG: hypothetical protein DMF94_11845 [Acidobacteriota bacterium]PYR43860.1 MAG: hypothetical protein DMF95_24810 [Acidobacteriota bacterium]
MVPPSLVIYVTQSFDSDAGRCIRAAADSPYRVVVVCEEPPRAIPDGLRDLISVYEEVDDVFDPGVIVRAIARLQASRASIRVLFSDDERAQVPLARVRAALKLPGLPFDTARNFRDKALMKRVWKTHGIPCADYRLVRTESAAVNAASALGLPLVMKPIDGMRSANTYRIRSLLDVRRYFDGVRAASPRGVLIEQFVDGEELSCEVVLHKGRLVWYSSTNYIPPPLKVVERRGEHFAVVLPRERQGADTTRAAGIAARAVRSLGLRTGMSHVEWFRRADGSVVISEAAARVPSAAISTLAHLADGTHLIDLWVRLLVLGQVDAPPPRRFAAAAVFLRGSGRGRIRAVRGLPGVIEKSGPLIVAADYPAVGTAIERDWDGNGSILFRSPSTRAVVEAVEHARRTIRITGW